MTTTCLPCEWAAAAEAEAIPDIAEGQSAKWSGPIGIEGQKTGDGRLIEPNALRWDTLPVPLRWAMQDFGAHDGAYVVGKIEAIERIDYDEANERLTSTGRDALPESFADCIIVWGSGVHDLGSEHGREAFRQVDEGLTPGISMDLDDIVVKENDDKDSLTILEGRVRAATQVAIPAFEGARISTSKEARETFDGDKRLEDLDTLMGNDEEAFNWVEDAGGLPEYIKRIKKHLEAKGMTESHAIATSVNVVKKMCATGDVNFPGSQEVNAGSRAEACAAVADWEAKKAKAHTNSGGTVNLTREQVLARMKQQGFLEVSEALFDEALSDGRITEAGLRKDGAILYDLTDSLVASVHQIRKAPPASWFDDPALQGPTGLTVTEDGRVFGHIALWGTCHIANPQGHKTCTQPPRSYSNYAYFRTGVTETDKGDIATGKITMSTLHAGPKLSANDAVYHYEHTGAVGADVNAGEDEFGIWVAGAARPGADRVALKAAPVSGDWRTIQGSLEMVGALSVNVPGFPVPRTQALVAGGAVQSLVASGVVLPDEKSADVLAALNLDDTAVLALRDRFRALDRLEKASALAAKVSRLAALEKVRRVYTSFAYNKDQWRVPKGNGELSGRFIDMPDAGVQDLFDTIADIVDGPSGSGSEDTRISTLGDDLGNALDESKKATEALRGGDGPGAVDAAKSADEHLSKVEASLQDLADDGTIPEDRAADLGDKLAAAREGVTTVKDSDLSLLGDKGMEGDDIGGDAPEGGDIGYEPGMKINPDGSATPTMVPKTPKNNSPKADAEKDKAPAPTIDDPQGEDPLSMADLLGEAGLSADDVDIVSQTGWINNPEEAGNGEQPEADRWKIMRALPEGTEIVTGQEPLNVNWKKDSSVEGGWVISEVGPGLNADDGYEVGGTMEGDPAHLDGGGDNDIYIKGIDDNTAQQANGAPPAPAAPADHPIGEPPGGAPGSEQQKQAKKTAETASKLEGTIMDAADTGAISEEDAAAVGDALSSARDSIDALSKGIQDGAYNAADLDAAKSNLSLLEANLMTAADKPDMPDEVANQIGIALDDMFAELGALDGLLKGSTEPPPFATRRYVRQWLGRRGIRLGTFAMRG